MKKEVVVMLIDSHAHLDDPFFDEIRREMIKNFEKDRLKFVVESSCDKKSIINAVELSNANNNIYAIIGVHPENAAELNAELEQLIKNNCENEKVIGIGEIGLDYHGEAVDKKMQKQAFLKQARIANDASLPVCIHLRDAYGDFFQLINENKNLFQNGLLFHCYSGSAEFARQVLDLIPNCYFAFGGVCTFKNATNVVESVKQIPIDRILSETDSPYLTPEPLRGKEKNRPKYVDYVVQELADIKQIPKEKMEQIIEENFKRLFKKVK